MRKRRLALRVFLVLFLLPRAAAEAQDDPWAGLWEGTFQIGEEKIEASLTVFPGGALLDMPSLNAFGWPLGMLRTQESQLYFSVGLGDEPLEGAGLRDGGEVSGVLLQGGKRGVFALSFPDSQPDRSGDLEIDTGRGILPGTLVLPADAPGPVPLVILISGSGTTDRDGNNWQVPGRNDSFRLFAQALAEEGIASFRYDKRGAGRAYRLGEDEASLLFSDHVRDASACMRFFHGDKRFSPILVFGHGDGALAGAAALRENQADASADAFAAFGVSGLTLRELIAESAASAPEEYRKEIEYVMSELEAGRFVEEVSPYIENLFRRSFQPYLASWLGYSLKTELAELTKAGLPVLLMQGDLDLQVTMQEFDLLRLAAPAAEAVLLPETNHMLKRVGNDVDQNYASFSDPSFPLSPGLVPALKDFLTRVPGRTPQAPVAPEPQSPRP